jgi:hypothetical protein
MLQMMHLMGLLDDRLACNAACFLLAACTFLLFLFLERIAGGYSFELSLTRTVGLRWLVPRPRAGGVIVVVLLVA